MAGPLIAQLGHEMIELEPEDVAAEITICCNTQQTYGGRTPYEMLYGQAPSAIINDLEEPGMAATADYALPFHRDAKVRTEAIKAFHEALLQSRLTGVMKERGHGSHIAQLFNVGDQVDFWREPTRKDLSGWRGPAQVTSISAEGRITVEWQGTSFTVPASHVQQHVPLIGVCTSSYVMSYFGTDADDSEPLLNNDTSVDTLMLMTERMSPGGSLLHVRRGGSLSSDAIRDSQVVYKLGLSLIHI